MLWINVAAAKYVDELSISYVIWVPVKENMEFVGITWFADEKLR